MNDNVLGVYSAAATPIENDHRPCFQLLQIIVMRYLMKGVTELR